MSVETRISRRQLLRRAGALGAGLALAGPILAACGPTPAPTATPAPKKEAVATPKPEEKPKVATPEVKAPAAKEVVKVRYHAFSGRYSDWADKRAKKFNGGQGAIEVAVEPVPGGEYTVKLRSMFTTKTIGDAFWYYNVGGGWLASWAHLGISRSCDDFVKKDGIVLTQWYDSAIKGITWQGKLMGLPIHGHPGFPAFAYNKKLLDQAGVKYPDPDPKWTLNDLIETAKKLTIKEGDKVKQFGWGTMTGYHAYVVWSRIFGTDIISEDGKKSLINTDKFKEALQWIYDSKWKHKVEPQPEQVEKGLAQMFVAGKCAMQEIDSTIGSTWHVEIKDFDWFASLLPPGPRGDRGALSTTHLSSLVSGSKYPEATWEFVKYMSTHASGVDKVLVGAGAPGARPDCYEDPQVLQAAPEYKVIAMAFKFAGAEHIPANVRADEYVTTLDNTLQDIWLNKVDVAKGAEIAHKAVQEVLDKPAE